MIEQFIKDIDNGLSSEPKHLPSKYFYDPIGDALFQQIMALPEYYLTRAEYEILSEKSEELVKGLSLIKETNYQFIELGAGDGKKTIKLLEYLEAHGYNFIYSPLDISQNALDGLEEKINFQLPDITIKTIQGDYFDSIEKIDDASTKKVILFLGSNMGNMSDLEAKNFMTLLGKAMNSGDQILLGLDLIKPREIVLPAYNDQSGITKKFNLNLLQRINRELGGEFDVSKWEHQPEYNEDTGEAKSFLKSIDKQNVYIKSTGKTYAFEKGELVFTEISRKYNDQILENIISHTSLRIRKKIFDSSKYFCNYILIK